MPNTGSPNRIRPISVPQATMPARKDLVPSIGSSTQTYSASVRSLPYSSPRMPCAHGILGEEYGSERTDAEYVWVLDPIDGTKSFLAGMVAWGTLIGLMRFGEPVFGMMHQPFTRERFAGDGGGARYRGPAGNRDLHVRACPGLSDALLFTTSPLLMNAADRAVFGRVENVVKLSRY